MDGEQKESFVTICPNCKYSFWVKSPSPELVALDEKDFECPYEVDMKEDIMCGNELRDIANRKRDIGTLVMILKRNSAPSSASLR